jgi:hypothetical protein
VQSGDVCRLLASLSRFLTCSLARCSRCSAFIALSGTCQVELDGIWGYEPLNSLHSDAPRHATPLRATPHHTTPRRRTHPHEGLILPNQPYMKFLALRCSLLTPGWPELAELADVAEAAESAESRRSAEVASGEAAMDAGVRY